MDFADLTLEFFLSARIEVAEAGRFLAIGGIDGQTVIAVVFRPLGSEAISLISMRRAGKNERNQRND